MQPVRSLELHSPKSLRAWFAAFGFLVSACAVAAAEPVRFERDVMAVLSKAGCNLGACHGNFNGKGGFRLSLRGEDPAADYAALLRQVEQRRVNLLDPEASLILQKPTGQVVHQGGLRFNRDSVEYQILRDWIASGAPGPSTDPVQLVGLVATPREPILIDPIESAQLQVTAHFADGSKRDVSQLACYEATNRNVMVEHDGLIRREKLGQSTVLIRYLTQQVAVRLAFLPAHQSYTLHSPSSSH